MSHIFTPVAPDHRRLKRLTQNAWLLLWVACATAALAWFAVDSTLRLGLGTASVTLLAVYGGLVFLARGGRGARGDDIVLRFLAEDTAPSIVLAADQSVLWANDAALARFPALERDGMVAALRPIMMSPAETLRRLHERLGTRMMVVEDLVVRRGHARAVLRRLSGNRVLFRLEHLVERAGDGPVATHVPLMTISAKGTILSMNEAMRQLLGERLRHIDRVLDAPLSGQGAVVALHAADGAEIRARVYHTGLQGDRREVAILPVDGDEGAAAATPASRERVELDDLPVAVLSVGRGGAVQSTNRAARRLLHIDDPDRDLHLSDLVTGLGRSVNDWVNDALDAPQPPQAEVMRVRRGDEECYTQVVLARSRADSAGSLIAVFHDATELKTLEAQFVQGQKMQAIGQLAGGVAHDFNNLLTAISGHCDLLLLRHDQGDPDYGDLVQINQNANRAASLVGQLLAFSRKQTLMPEVVDLRDTLADLTHLLNRLVGEPITLSLYHDPDLPAIRADKRQLEQVVMNLVVNARDAMPEGGDITVETRRVLLDEPVHRDRARVPAGEYACVLVRDQGKGIAPETLEKVFEPFFTTKRVGEGTGLGLSTAYGIIKQSGGFIFVDSMRGKGTEFTLYLPAFHGQGAAKPAEPAPVPDPAQIAGPTDGVILLVEDEAPVRAFAARALRLRGYTVLEAASGEEALTTLENDALEIDLFVSDVIMPGLDGPSWVKAARQVRPRTKAVFVSGYAEDLLTDDQVSLDNAVFLPKPFSLQQLTDTVRAQLR